MHYMQLRAMHNACNACNACKACKSCNATKLWKGPAYCRKSHYEKNNILKISYTQYKWIPDPLQNPNTQCNVQCFWTHTHTHQI